MKNRDSAGRNLISATIESSVTGFSPCRSGPKRASFASSLVVHAPDASAGGATQPEALSDVSPARTVSLSTFSLF